MLDVRYIAGFIDGEGCIYYHKTVSRCNNAFTGTICVRVGNESKAIVERIPELDPDNLVFQWNEELERWEAYDVTTIGTLVAHNTGSEPVKDWVEV